MEFLPVVEQHYIVRKCQAQDAVSREQNVACTLLLQGPEQGCRVYIEKNWAEWAAMFDVHRLLYRVTVLYAAHVK